MNRPRAIHWVIVIAVLTFLFLADGIINRLL